MPSDTRPQARIGINFVSSVVEEHWRSGFQELKPENDDGLDGLVLMRRNGHDTGQVVWVQVKGGPSWRIGWKTRPDDIGIKLGKAYIESHRPRWGRVRGPCILVMVEPRSKHRRRAWWFDLKDPLTYPDSRTDVLVTSRERTFGPHAKPAIANLARSQVEAVGLPVVVATRSELVQVPLSGSLLEHARGYYRAWASLPSTGRACALGEVQVGRSGWRHMTRKGRGVERIHQSLHLLPMARRILLEAKGHTWIRHHSSTPTPSGAILRDLVALRALVQFPHRDAALVQVLLKRKRTIDGGITTETLLWFHSVYELRRGRQGEA